VIAMLSRNFGGGFSGYFLFWRRCFRWFLAATFGAAVALTAVVALGATLAFTAFFLP